MIYRLSAKAEADLLAVWIYAAEQWGPDQADRYVDTLLKRFQWLAENRTIWTTTLGSLTIGRSIPGH
jgi:plasmid stabilization system protein ParE